MKKTFLEIATEIGELVERKNAAYGSSFAKAGEFLRLLYPDGLRPEQFTDALLLVRDFDKSMRIATDRDALGESPWADKAGYGILGAHLHQQKVGSGECLVSVSGSDAVQSSRDGSTGSAATSINEPTTTSENESSGTQPLTRPASFCAQHRDAIAPTATGNAKPSAEERLREISRQLISRLKVVMRGCNRFRLCARCGQLMATAYLRIDIFGEKFAVCHLQCVPLETLSLEVGDPL